MSSGDGNTLAITLSASPILVAEDNADDVLLLKLACANAGLCHPVQIVADGSQAIHYLAGEGQFTDRTIFPLPCLLLLDLKMPGKNGFDVLSWIREQPFLRRLEIVVFSSSPDPGDINRAYDLGANSYAVKPNSTEELRRLVEGLRDWWVAISQHPRLIEGPPP